MTSVSYGGIDGPVYLNIRDSDEAQQIFNKFVNSLINDDEWQNSSVVYNGELYARLKSTLIEYNAVYKFNQSKAGHIKRHFIRFGTPMDLTAFLMRYS